MEACVGGVWEMRGGGSMEGDGGRSARGGRGGKGVAEKIRIIQRGKGNEGRRRGGSGGGGRRGGERG